jgi:hypothetical protein
MQRSVLALGSLSVLSAFVALFAASGQRSLAWGAATVAQTTAAPQSNAVNPDVYSARVDARDYLRNPDATARIVFTNTSGVPVAITLCGSKNAQEAASRFGETGPLELRAGYDIGTDTMLLGSVMRNQPFFALHVTVPAGTPEKPMHVFLWNGDRDRAADLNWRLLVGSPR